MKKAGNDDYIAARLETRFAYTYSKEEIPPYVGPRSSYVVGIPRPLIAAGYSDAVNLEREL
jgi:hypothetical protein